MIIFFLIAIIFTHTIVGMEEKNTLPQLDSISPASNYLFTHHDTTDKKLISESQEKIKIDLKNNPDEYEVFCYINAWDVLEEYYFKDMHLVNCYDFMTQSIEKHEQLLARTDLLAFKDTIGNSLFRCMFKYFLFLSKTTNDARIVSMLDFMLKKAYFYANLPQLEYHTILLREAFDHSRQQPLSLTSEATLPQKRSHIHIVRIDKEISNSKNKKKCPTINKEISSATIQCANCDKNYQNSMESLTNHIEWYHKISESTFSCPDCNRKFNSIYTTICHKVFNH